MTAYEISRSDWSSDVCSSDLLSSVTLHVDNCCSLLCTLMESCVALHVDNCYSLLCTSPAWPCMHVDNCCSLLYTSPASPCLWTTAAAYSARVQPDPACGQLLRLLCTCLAAAYLPYSAWAANSAAYSAALQLTHRGSKLVCRLKTK